MTLGDTQLSSGEIILSPKTGVGLTKGTAVIEYSAISTSAAQTFCSLRHAHTSIPHSPLIASIGVRHSRLTDSRHNFIIRFFHVFVMHLIVKGPSFV